MRQRTDQLPTAATDNAGFTLVELMVVLAIFSILLSLAAPSFSSIIANNQVTSAANNLVTILNLGKNEAVRSGQTVVLCKKTGSNQCDADTSGDWSNGWVLFVDEDDDNEVDAGERIVRVESAPDAGLSPVYNGAGASDRLINFTPNGRASPNGSFCLNNSNDADNSRAVSVSLAGRVETDIQPYADCTA